MLWIPLKWGRSKGRVSGFLSTVSHKENGPKTWENMSDSMCFGESTCTWRMLVVFNGVEQCEKCLSRCNSEVHQRGASCSIHLDCTLALTFSFFLSLFPSISHFLHQLTVVYVMFLPLRSSALHYVLTAKSFHFLFFSSLDQKWERRY